MTESYSRKQPPMEPFPSRGAVAYFSMEIAIDPRMPTYSGGLGVLSGDTLRSAADLGLPLVAITLLHRKGYFRQKLDDLGRQTETIQAWNPSDFLSEERARVAINIEGRQVWVRAWRYDLRGHTGWINPIYLLDTNLEENCEWDRGLTDHLYGGDTNYRFQQEMVLGMAGVAILEALGHDLNAYHMNEGHAALLTLALLEDHLGDRPLHTVTEADIKAVHDKCVFTTHTPVPAGHDRFTMEQSIRILGGERTAVLERLNCCHDGLLNLTYIALRFSRFVNGVALEHGKVSREMFPEYKIDSITNGVHAPTWLSAPMVELLDVAIPRWREDNLQLRNAIQTPIAAIQKAHRQSKQSLFAEVATRTGVMLNPDLLTIGFARRAATYKRADLLFTDPARLAAIAKSAGGMQILYAGKAHPQDAPGKALIQRVIQEAKLLSDDTLQILYLENYEWELGAMLTAGVDVWLNTPRRPLEASGTSGMKAALNGVPSLSILDGWWIEGCAENVTGWAIEDGATDADEAEHLYKKLEGSVVPLYTATGDGWGQLMRTTIALNGSFFNTDRMVEQYIRNAYYPVTLVPAPQEVEAAVGD